MTRSSVLETELDIEMRAQRAATIQGLRDLAEFLEAHPAVPLPYMNSMNAFVDDRQTLAAVARAASWQKVYRDTWFTLHREFSGDVSLDVNTDRSTVCRKVVTGTRIKPAEPEQTVETYEWVCEDAALLADPEAQS